MLKTKPTMQQQQVISICEIISSNIINQNFFLALALLSIV